MLKRLRIQFVVVIMVIVTAMLCLIFGMVYSFTKINLEAESIDMMQTIATTPFQLGRPDTPSDEIRLPYFLLQIGPGGNLIATGGGYYDLSDEVFLEDLIRIAFTHRGQIGVIEEYHLRFCRVITPFGQNLVFADTSSERSTLRSLARTCIFIGVLCFIAFLGISILLANWMVRPVDRAWRQQRQFVADASHELKTPLTVITTNAELLQLPDCNEADKARCSSSILAMSRQMRSLVERLLELARADCEQSQMTFARLDYSALIELALLPFEPVFFEKGLLLSGQIQPNIQVNGSAPHLQQVIDILLDNAQKYSVSPGTVEVKLQQNGRHHCLLSVSNPGGPISKEDLKQIFKRFYRLDPARTGDGSFGLGLSIAESIIAEHRGRIWAESGDGRVTFLIELPTRG